MMSSPQEKQGYHHGDLRRSLIDTGLLLVREIGIDALSLRKLAERVGVSTPALYHHFRNKQDLLYALGEASIQEFEAVLRPTLGDDSTLEDFALAYVGFARNNPELYELMLGRTTWRGDHPAPFHRAARQSVRLMGQRLLSLLLGLGRQAEAIALLEQMADHEASLALNLSSATLANPQALELYRDLAELQN